MESSDIPFVTQSINDGYTPSWEFDYFSKLVRVFVAMGVEAQDNFVEIASSRKR